MSLNAKTSATTGAGQPDSVGNPSGTVRTIKEVTCQRSLEFDLVRFTWNVENFSFYRDSRGVLYDVLESPHFQTDDGQFDWVLRLIVHPRPDRPGDELCRDSVQIFLHLHEAPRETAHLKCQFVFVRHAGGPKEDHTYQISRFREFRRGETWGFRRFIQRSTLFEGKNGFILNERLTVKINLDIIRGTKDETVRMPRTLTHLQPGKEELAVCQSMRNLFQNRTHTDLNIMTGEDLKEVTKAHKAILSSRSPVFEAMLTHDLNEKRLSKIEMDDVPTDVLKVFLEMLYTGSCEEEDLEEHAASLLVLGEKYQVKDIKEKALDILRERMSHSNVADLLTLSDVHNAPELKDDVMDFIISQWDKVRETEAWKELRNTHPALVEGLFDRLHTPKRQKTSSNTSAPV
ncbi:hypothetical protein RvY_14222 [Ramazzottius varieornatus]|uniref:BTB domain-containing protein n=1 Tax=Ramazzottius varieornatus TaxID=947166 RepID=A0A1D1VVN4_RAMVA|nr:hypothetical protein RvY_14222 [Ramazzottius varieornatus]